MLLKSDEMFGALFKKKLKVEILTIKALVNHQFTKSVPFRVFNDFCCVLLAFI